jgi:hypothetical protein
MLEYLLNELVVYESLPANLFWLKNSRQVEKIARDSTKLTYHLEFDADIVKYGIGFKLPMFFLRYYTKATMNKYLNKLKLILEKGDQAT